MFHTKGLITKEKGKTFVLRNISIERLFIDRKRPQSLCKPLVRARCTSAFGSDRDITLRHRVIGCRLFGTM